MQTFYFTLAEDYESCKRLYKPEIKAVVMIDDSNKRVQIPVVNLRAHVSIIGIRGRFRLIIDDNKKLLSFEKM